MDDTAGTARWVEGDKSTLPYLEANGFDVKSEAAARLAIAGARRMAVSYERTSVGELLWALIDKGLPLRRKVDNVIVGEILISAAARSGQEHLFKRLAEAGFLRTLPKPILHELFRSVGCSPAIARALVKAGANPRSLGEEGSALNTYTGTATVCDGNDAKTTAMIETLIGLGVPLEARNSYGWTALMGTNSPALARLLISRGADVNAREADGTTPVLSTNDDRVALILLRAGANPRARNAHGTVLQQAAKGHMPATIAWLNAHGIR